VTNEIIQEGRSFPVAPFTCLFSRFLVVAGAHKKSPKTEFCTKSPIEQSVNALDFLGKTDFLCKALPGIQNDD
jgi:hypothetical protein